MALSSSTGLSHLPLLGGDDEPKTLSYQITIFGPIGADVRQVLSKDSEGVLSWNNTSYVPKTITLTAGIGLAGLGDLSANRSVALNLNSISTATPIGTDKLTFVNGSGHFTAALSEIIRMAKPSGARNFFFSQMAS